MIESMAGKSGAMHGLVHDATPFTFSEENSAIDYFGKMLTAGRLFDLLVCNMRTLFYYTCAGTLLKTKIRKYSLESIASRRTAFLKIYIFEYIFMYESTINFEIAWESTSLQLRSQALFSDGWHWTEVVSWNHQTYSFNFCPQNATFFAATIFAGAFAQNVRIHFWSYKAYTVPQLCSKRKGFCSAKQYLKLFTVYWHFFKHINFTTCKHWTSFRFGLSMGARRNEQIMNYVNPYLHVFVHWRIHHNLAKSLYKKSVLWRTSDYYPAHLKCIWHDYRLFTKNSSRNDDFNDVLLVLIRSIFPEISLIKHTKK